MQNKMIWKLVLRAGVFSVYALIFSGCGSDSLPPLPPDQKVADQKVADQAILDRGIKLDQNQQDQNADSNTLDQKVIDGPSIDRANMDSVTLDLIKDAPVIDSIKPDTSYDLSVHDYLLDFSISDSTHDYALIDLQHSDGCMPTMIAETICNGVDDDCDGQIDEDFKGTATTCGYGPCAVKHISECINGKESECIPGKPTASTDSVCDGIDEDCDGQVDEDFKNYIKNCGDGVCRVQETIECIKGQLTQCIPGEPLSKSDATCDGIDDNCNGSVDENFVGTTTTCGYGPCEVKHTSECIKGQETTCTPTKPSASSDPTCDNIDEDCDGLVDEDYVPQISTCGDGACAVKHKSECIKGTETICVPKDPISSDDATCDGIDDNCSGKADEDYKSVTSTCGDGACRVVHQSECVDGKETVCEPDLPSFRYDIMCSNTDEDCDGLVDEDWGTTSFSLRQYRNEATYSLNYFGSTTDGLAMLEDCAPDQVMIGLHGYYDSATRRFSRTGITCASLQSVVSRTCGTMDTTNIKTLEVHGWKGWAGNTYDLRCDQGQVMVGFGAYDPSTNVVNTLAIRCAPIKGLYLGGTLFDVERGSIAQKTLGSVSSPSVKDCANSDEVVVGITARIGFGLDGIGARCRKLKLEETSLSFPYSTELCNDFEDNGNKESNEGCPHFSSPTFVSEPQKLLVGTLKDSINCPAGSFLTGIHTTYSGGTLYKLDSTCYDLSSRHNFTNPYVYSITFPTKAIQNDYLGINSLYPSSAYAADCNTDEIVVGIGIRYTGSNIHQVTLRCAPIEVLGTYGNGQTWTEGNLWDYVYDDTQTHDVVDNKFVTMGTLLAPQTCSWSKSVIVSGLQGSSDGTYITGLGMSCQRMTPVIQGM